MKILGIVHDVTNTSAALIDNGEVVAACAEERLVRIKRYRFFPHKAIQFCLEKANCTIEDVEYIAHGFNPAIYCRRNNLRFSHIPRWRAEYFFSIPNNLSDKYDGHFEGYARQEIGVSLLNGKKTKCEIIYVDHHLSHCANAFLLSPYEDAAIFSADGRGEHSTGMFAVGNKNKIEVIKEIPYPHSIGLFYGIFTEHLGFRLYSDEWKVMALSAYATDKRMNEEYYKKIRGLVSVDNNGTFEMDLSFFMHFLQDQSGYSSSKLIQLIGPTRENNDELTERHYAIAHAVQKVTEDILTQMLNWLYEQTGLERVTVSGGTFMNSLFNGKIRDKTDFKEVFISSCPDDIGTSIGAALYVYNHLLGNKKRYVQKHNYYGPEFSNNEVRETLDRYKVKYESVDNITEYTAKLLAEGYLIGWFQGRMEYGERALGNRSILADPRDSSMKDKINAAVKYRESFRPFAPSILYEKTGEYFEIPDSVGVPFMEQICKVKKEKQEEIPAVVHKDGTGRLQTVKKDINARFYDLIKSFYGITGVPVVLNTSFNLNGEPIVCSPNDAIRTFYTCGLDYLVMGNYVIKK